MPSLDLGINVTICGMSIVFIVLILLVIIMTVSGAINKPRKPKKEKKAKKVKEDVPPQAEASAPAGQVSDMVIEDVDDEVVAVITAAVYAMYCGSDVTPKIALIKPAGNRRPAWSSAGIAQNTKAF